MTAVSKNIKEVSDTTYKSLLDFTIELYHLQNMRDVLDLVITRAATLLNADRCTLYRYDRKGNQLVSEYYYGEKVKQIRLSVDESSIAGYCGFTRKVVKIHDVYSDLAYLHKELRFSNQFDKINNYRTRSIISAPLLDHNQQLLGVLSLINKLTGDGFSSEDETLIELFARHASIAVSRLKKQEMATVFSEDEQQYLKGAHNIFVIFFDIINYTKLSEVLGDRKIKKIIKFWEEDLIRLINDFGGIYVKSVGDEVMCIFGLDHDIFHNQIISNREKPNLSSLRSEMENFDSQQAALSNHDNLISLIVKHNRWLKTNLQYLDKRMQNKIRSRRERLWAENVIRFMYLAQKHLDWLNRFFHDQKLIGPEKSQRIYMKGGTEYGSVLVDFDIYGRIDVIGDVVNVASRITDVGNKYTIGKGDMEHPLVIGQSFQKLLVTDNFVNLTQNRVRLKGKDKPQNVFNIDSIVSMENRSHLPAAKFQKYRAYLNRQISRLNRVKQGALPFNYASYNIETNDKYKVDHSKRVGINVLHLVELINEDIKRSITYEKGRLEHYKTSCSRTKERIAALHAHLDAPDADISQLLFQKSRAELNHQQQLLLNFSLPELENWGKENRKLLQADSGLNEIYIHEINLFKSLEHDTGKSWKQHVLKEVLSNKMDELNDAKNSVGAKKNRIKELQDTIITAKQREKCLIAALLHDLGRHSLNDQIKDYVDPTKSITELSEEEKEMFTRITTSFGASILAGIDELVPISSIVQCCDLHYNGFYYSKKTENLPSGKAIPIESRIVTIANAMDAILSDSPFRQGHNFPEMCQTLLNDTNVSSEDKVQKFDPYIITLLIDSYKQYSR